MRNLNLVLLGLPSSGKSALLGALEDAAAIKGTELDGTLVDLTGGELAKLRKTSLEETYRPTADAVAAYPVKRRAEENDTFTVLDTSGQDSQKVLTGESGDKDPLPMALADSDGVIVVIDASTSREERGKQFAQVIEFLKSWQMQRSRSAKVGGLPVYIVLSKCDRLAAKDVSVDEWKQRVREISKDASEQFKKSLADTRELSFGRIDFEVIPTAAKRPFGEKSNRPNEPFQVDKVFQRIFDAARAYRDCGERSSQTLHGALVGLLGAAVLLVLFIAWYWLTRPTPEEADFHRQVDMMLLGSEGNPAEKFREPIDDRLKELATLKANPLYETLPADTQDNLDETERSLHQYEEMSQKFNAGVALPRTLTSVEKLIANEKALASFDSIADKWPETRLAKRQAEWLKDTQALKAAIEGEAAWMQKQVEEGETLHREAVTTLPKASPKEREAWFKAVHEYVVRPRRYTKRSDLVPQTSISYATVYQFDTVKSAERMWAAEKSLLRTIRDKELMRK